MRPSRRSWGGRDEELTRPLLNSASDPISSEPGRPYELYSAQLPIPSCPELPKDSLLYPVVELDPPHPASRWLEPAETVAQPAFTYPV